MASYKHIVDKFFSEYDTDGVVAEVFEKEGIFYSVISFIDVRVVNIQGSIKGSEDVEDTVRSSMLFIPSILIIPKYEMVHSLVRGRRVDWGYNYKEHSNYLPLSMCTSSSIKISALNKNGFKVGNVIAIPLEGQCGEAFSYLVAEGSLVNIHFYEENLFKLNTVSGPKNVDYLVCAKIKNGALSLSKWEEVLKSVDLAEEYVSVANKRISYSKLNIGDISHLIRSGARASTVTFGNYTDAEGRIYYTKPALEDFTNCYLCGHNYGPKQDDGCSAEIHCSSLEHFIPKWIIGGTNLEGFKSNILCVCCNNKLGAGIEEEYRAYVKADLIEDNKLKYRGKDIPTRSLPWLTEIELDRRRRLMANEHEYMRQSLETLKDRYQIRLTDYFDGEIDISRLYEYIQVLNYVCDHRNVISRWCYKTAILASVSSGVKIPSSVKISIDSLEPHGMYVYYSPHIHSGLGYQLYSCSYFSKSFVEGGSFLFSCITHSDSFVVSSKELPELHRHGYHMVWPSFVPMNPRNYYYSIWNVPDEWKDFHNIILSYFTGEIYYPIPIQDRKR